MTNDHRYIRFSLILTIIVLVSGPLGAQQFIREIPLPSADYARVESKPGSFAQWLRDLPLEPPGSPVMDYRGKIFKSAEDSIVAAVISHDVTGRRLEQCMDILVRFYADYLWKQKNVSGLSLPLPGGYWLNWADWEKGYRPVFQGIKMSLDRNSGEDSSYGNFNRYLATVFNNSHTQQFYHAFQRVNIGQVQIGDFIVRKGSRGHAVLIVDLARNNNGDFIALIGNGDTPACQFFLLNHRSGEPWIPLTNGEEIVDLPLRRQMYWEGLRRFDSALPINN